MGSVGVSSWTLATTSPFFLLLESGTSVWKHRQTFRSNTLIDGHRKWNDWRRLLFPSRCPRMLWSTFQTCGMLNSPRAVRKRGPAGFLIGIQEVKEDTSSELYCWVIDLRGTHSTRAIALRLRLRLRTHHLPYHLVLQLRVISRGRLSTRDRYASFWSARRQYLQCLSQKQIISIRTNANNLLML